MTEKDCALSTARLHVQAINAHQIRLELNRYSRDRHIISNIMLSNRAIIMLRSTALILSRILPRDMHKLDITLDRHDEQSIDFKFVGLRLSPQMQRDIMYRLLKIRSNLFRIYGGD